MRKIVLVAAATASLLALSACGGKQGGVFAGRSGPDEFAVARQAPLVIPPDFAMVPPKPGAPRPMEADSSTQALQAMFGGQAPRSGAESGLVNQAGQSGAPAIRSQVADPATTVVDKGAVTRDILAAPEGPGQEATATTPQ
ncbi:Beta-barrel assembly machine subunit BamF [Sphingomonas laterariae]|uniref:Beta-barrel assembly machine subunit BamF n=1 Tax=Edaphosphingomonas laterariae TaxID=861865 RepID=A0A239F1W4_9SPHN|nr:DUF3035 domain-containing protein [Sphingomonas laterariae]SNS50538.1 Beta-barrel assembly machine subunit BamF [Sphingomonas laterariae]